MRIGARLPHDLWQETVNSAVYLFNRTPRYSNNWQTPYERFYTYLDQEVGTDLEPILRRPQLAYLKAYGCRAYAMTKDAQLKKKRLFKLDPRAHIGYLVGYDSTNIYRIWIPHQGKVISTRDVIFDKNILFDRKKEALIDALIRAKDAFIQKVTLPKKLVTNTQIVQEDDDTIVVDIGDLEMASDDTIVVDTGHLEQLGLDLHDAVCKIGRASCRERV